MADNDYSRSLIMLRSLMQGYSGHARLERRVMMGSIYIVVTSPQGAGELRAALVGQKRGEYFAFPLGTLKRDMRGQAILSVPIDPRDIGGRPLDSYAFITVSDVLNNTCSLVLAGNIAGSVDAQWQEVRDTVCALYITEETAPPVQEETAPEPEPEITEYEKTEAPLPFDESYASVKLPELDGCGWGEAYIAARLQDESAALCLAVKGEYSAEPPTGFSADSWRDGWWVWCGTAD